MPTPLQRPFTEDERLMREFLERVMDEFEKNIQGPRLLRHLAAQRPELFYSVAVRMLRDAPACPGRRHLTAMLMRDPDIVARISSRRDFTRIDTALVYQRMMEVDPVIDVRLARELPDRYGQTRALNLQASANMLDVLDQISPGRRLIHMIGYLSEHFDPAISAKATLLVARRVQNADWIRNHIAAGDPRIRANTVEGLWGSKQDYAVKTFEECMRDQDNRVVGNALFGLHLVGEPRVRPKLADMAHDGRPPFRWTAAWMMGQVADPQYVEPLHRLVRDDAPGVRRAALRSLITIRRVTHPKSETLPPEAEAAAEAEAEAAAASVPEGPPPTQVFDEAWHYPGLRLDGRSFRSREAKGG